MRNFERETDTTMAFPSTGPAARSRTAAGAPGSKATGRPVASSLYERAVLSAFRAMRHGTLTMRLPNGSIRRFGDGSNPRGSRFGLDARMRIVRDDFFRRCFYWGDIGFAEGWMAGDWETDDLAEVVSWFILNAELSPSQSASRARRRLLNSLGWLNGLAHRLRANTIEQSRTNIAEHYDLGNDFFSLFLDPSMTYSSALFSSPTSSLHDAQIEKYDRLCRMLELSSNDRLLEIGGGWGAFSRHAAKRYGCHVTTVTISKAQYDWARERLEEEGLTDRVDLRLMDYRKIEGTWDKIVSIEMLEAVGHEYLDTWFRRCQELLAPNGLLAIQVITCPESRYERMRRGVDFIQKHIFPGGLVPSTGAILGAVQRTGDLTLHDFRDLGDSYARTLADWKTRFEANLQEVRALGFDESFIRKWQYYFAYCEAGFRMRHISVVQMLLTRPNNHALRSDLLAVRGAAS